MKYPAHHAYVHDRKNPDIYMFQIWLDSYYDWGSWILLGSNFFASFFTVVPFLPVLLLISSRLWYTEFRAIKFTTYSLIPYIILRLAASTVLGGHVGHSKQTLFKIVSVATATEEQTVQEWTAMMNLVSSKLVVMNANIFSYCVVWA